MPDPNKVSPLLTPAEAARWLRLSVGHLAKLRSTRSDGPPFIKVGKKIVLYRLADLENYVAERLRQSTSDRQGEGGA